METSFEPRRDNLFWPGGMSSSSMLQAHAAVHRVSMRTGSWQLFPRFKDAVVEAAYMTELNRRNRRLLCKVWPAGSMIIIVLFFGHGMYSQITCMEMAPAAVGWSYLCALLSVQFVPALAFLMSAPVDCSFLLSAVLCSVSLQTGRCILYVDCCGWQWRWQKATNSCNTAACSEVANVHGDVELLLLFMLLSCTMILVFELRSSLSWVLPAVHVCCYVAAMMLAGMGPESILECVFSVLLFAILGIICCRMRFAAELRDRSIWAQQCSFALQARRRSEVISKLREDLEELNVQQDSLHQPEAEPPVTSHVRRMSTVQSDDSEEYILPRTVPPLPLCDPPSRPCGNTPNALLASLMEGRTADAERIRRMAIQIREPSYTLKAFFDDSVAAFPELQLFFAKGVGTSSSGCESAKEYQRTIGALFAVFWLLRLDIDGKNGFCFGVDEDWAVHERAFSFSSESRVTSVGEATDDQKREAFFHVMDWSKFSEIMDMANLNCVDTVAAMLCLTAFHDIMKVEELCPVVQPEYAPYLGHDAGTIIHDHDQALSYLLEHHSELLPSFVWLPEAAKRSILFSQSKLQFNHGWFVQAEAPPGAMLTTFKRTLQGANPGDLAFYFFHWLTDLAGAEGSPLAGAEKFTVKFPNAVLQAFLWSIPYLRNLEKHTETEVVQDYLEARWLSSFPETQLPNGPSLIAKLRLVVMAQGGAREALDSFDLLPAESITLLSTELARTGMASQSYRGTFVAGGPAFLVYYGPALLQRCQGDPERMYLALRALVAVFEAGRKLWPADLLLQGSTVTLQVGKLKAHDVKHIFSSLPGEARSMWVLVQQSESEAVCDLYGAPDLNEFNETGKRYCVLDLRQKLEVSDGLMSANSAVFQASMCSSLAPTPADMEAILAAEACAEVPQDIDDTEEDQRPLSLPVMLGRHYAVPHKIKALSC